MNNITHMSDYRRRNKLTQFHDLDSLRREGNIALARHMRALEWLINKVGVKK